MLVPKHRLQHELEHQLPFPRKEAYSANVKDVLGENSSALGWALAVGGGAAGLGICGVAGGFTLRLSNVALENGPFISDSPIETSIPSGVSRPSCLITRK